MTIKELKEKLNEYEFDEDVPVVLFIECPSTFDIKMCNDFDISLDADGEELYILGKESPGAVGIDWK